MKFIFLLEGVFATRQSQKSVTYLKLPVRRDAESIHRILCTVRTKLIWTQFNNQIKTVQTTGTVPRMSATSTNLFKYEHMFSFPVLRPTGVVILSIIYSYNVK